MNSAYFAGGCFWCITPAFRSLTGVSAVTSGYCGGSAEDAVYEAVKSQRTAHRETIRIDYDPDQIGYAALLRVFLANVDPFDPFGQYIDRGNSYTLAIYFADDEERRQAADALRELEVRAGKAPAVAVEPLNAFYPAEEYHQDYDLKNPEAFARELKESGRI